MMPETTETELPIPSSTKALVMSSVSSPQNEGEVPTKQTAGGGGGSRPGAAIMDRISSSKILDTITQTDIRRINGSLRLANISFSAIYIIVGIAGIFTPSSYSEMIVATDVVISGMLLLVFEFRDRIPILTEHIKVNFGFLFTAIGRAVMMVLMGLLVFSQGWFGIIVGMMFILLATFNFFIIQRHPGYKETMMMNEENNSMGSSTTTTLPSQAKAFPNSQVVV